MPSNKPQISARITEQQEAAINAALAVSGDELAQAVRKGVALYCQSCGIEWPEDMPRRGKYNRNPME